MSLYPEVQAKARQEIDRVVGRDRLPNLSDIDSLPYVSAVVLEALRWNPPVATGVSSTASIAVSFLDHDCRYTTQVDTRRHVQRLLHSGWNNRYCQCLVRTPLTSLSV